MISWYRLVFVLGMFAGHQIICLESSAKPCTFEQTLKKLILQKWTHLPDVLLDRYAKTNVKGVKASQLSCHVSQDVKKYITEGLYSLFNPHWVYFVSPKVYNLINIQIPEYPYNNLKINQDNQYQESTAPQLIKNTYYGPKALKDSSNETFMTSLTKFNNLFYQVIL